MIALIDYDAGNIRSVEKAIEALGETPIITRDKAVIKSADKVILPGVGSFGDAMRKLREYDLFDCIKEVANEKPFLGICLGLQLLFESSEESPGVEGLSILKGKIRKIPQKDDLKIPHMGWNSLSFPRETKLFQGVSPDAYVYFVHSYYLASEEDIVSSTTEYGTLIHASVEKGMLYACQFHPEKSSTVGLQILKNFIEI